MRSSANRQTVSSTARWNLVQSDPSRVGAQKKPVKNQQTGQGTNIAQLKRALAVAELHLAQTNDPRTIQNMRHGIDLLKAQIARAAGNSTHEFDLFSVPESSTGFHFQGFIEPKGDLDSSALAQDAYTQSLISPFAAYQLAGTLRQRITKVAPPANATPGGSLVHPGVNPRDRSNVIRTPNNPSGSVFDTGVPGTAVGFHPVADTRNDGYSGRAYLQGFTPGTHNLDLLDSSNGFYLSDQPMRGKHGQFKGGYVWKDDSSTSPK